MGEKAKFEAAKRNEDYKHELRRTKQTNELALRATAQEAQTKVACEDNAALVKLLGNLGELGVDITKLLTSDLAKDVRNATQEKLSHTLSKGLAAVTLSFGDNDNT